METGEKKIIMEINDEDLKKRIDMDLAARLPPSVKWDIKIEVFLPYNVGITYENGRYLCTFCIFIGFMKEQYQPTIDYTVEFIKDYQSKIG